MHPQVTSNDTSQTSAGCAVGAIPARYGSTRLPGKPLLPIAGRPMIEHVYRRAAQAQSLGRVVVLTDDERIAEVVARFGGDWEMTPLDCASGTDRIAHAARNWPEQVVINIQGDEPLIDPQEISRLANHLADCPDDPMATLAVDAKAGELEDPNVVKVVVDQSGYALYFSRAAIPYPRNPAASSPLKHLGIYGYQRMALLELARLEPSPLEETEALEQLRALENGIRIRVLKACKAGPGVDTLEDLKRVESLLKSETEA